MVTLFSEIAVVMIIAFILAITLNKLKQPLLIAYILTGIIAGPVFFNLLPQPHQYEIFSHIGVAFLLFIVGLQLNPKLIKEVGTISLVTGLGQIIFTSLFGLLINRLLGFAWIPSILLAVALAFSSTIIIVKLLSDTKGLEQLYGKISLGFLLVQDFVAVLMLMIVGTFSGGVQQTTSSIIQIVGIGVLATIFIFLLGRVSLTPVLKKIAHYKELLFLFVIAWCFGIAVGYEYIGFSLEIGALIAGILLAATPYQQDIAGRIKPLKDFFIILFFIFLGTQLIPFQAGAGAGALWPQISSTLGPLLPKALLLAGFVLLGNPLIVLLLVTFFGYSAKTGFLSGLTVSQISEFSIILVILGQEAGFLNETHVSLITLVAIITIICSTYMVVYGDKLYKLFSPLIKRLEKKKIKDSLQGLQGKKHSVGIFGYRRLGPHILEAIKKKRKSYLIIDHNPQTITKLKEKNEPAIFGDISSVEFLSEFDFKDMEIIVCTINDFAVNKLLLENYKAKNPKGIAILTADEKEEAIQLYEDGANYVIEPHRLGGYHIEILLKEFAIDKKRFHKEKKKHLGQLKK